MSDIIKVRNGNSWIGVPSMAGAPGQKGADGVSPTFSVAQTSTGADLTITDVNGTHTVSLFNGPKGEKGEQGPKGDSPIKGIDYWTTSDQDEVVAAAVIQVLDRLPSAENNSY